ncbi:MAG: cell division protein SepF [Actinobacteria bacterium]|nr:cell division protein SepF [Actinomycetota bacterium]MBV9934745.1 cell division protein SepF [Actinomycetota bacterium]
MAPERQRFTLRSSEELMGVMDAFKAGKDLELDLNAMTDQDRRRAIDVLSGFAYGFDANLQRTDKHQYTLLRL